MELERELEQNNWLKVLINANWKKILLVERLIGSQPDLGMAIMWGMRSQVFCSFDVAAARYAGSN